MAQEKKQCPSRRGRRPGMDDVWPVILRAAQGEFSARGYQNATMPGIAREASVNPKLLHDYFGTKSELFDKAVVDVITKQGIVDDLFTRQHAGDSRGTQYFPSVLEMDDSPEVGGSAIGLLRNIAAHEESRALVLETFGKIRHWEISAAATRTRFGQTTDIRWHSDNRNSHDALHPEDSGNYRAFTR
ncbi:MAG: helix-turn-helix domain-containing protein [Actinomycetaceae bacterium]|nr:helix-turn-helix domain-containing protein [Actinomycetaceae bacterium]